MLAHRLPGVPGRRTRRMHWGFPDPAKATARTRSGCAAYRAVLTGLGRADPPVPAARGALRGGAEADGAGMIALYLLRHAHAGDPGPLDRRRRAYARFRQGPPAGRAGGRSCSPRRTSPRTCSSPPPRCAPTRRRGSWPAALGAPIVVDERLGGAAVRRRRRGHLSRRRAGGAPVPGGPRPGLLALLGELLGVAADPDAQGRHRAGGLRGHVRGPRGPAVPRAAGDPVGAAPVARRSARWRSPRRVHLHRIECVRGGPGITTSGQVRGRPAARSAAPRRSRAPASCRRPTMRSWT